MSYFKSPGQAPRSRTTSSAHGVLETLEDHILLSSDQGNVRQFKRYYGHGWSSVLMQFVPKLRYAGVPETSIRKVLVDNPRRFLAFVPKA